MSYQYQTREVNHGNAYGLFAEISQDAQGNITYGTPYEFTGLVSVDISTEQSSEQTYADNVPHVLLRGSKVVSGSLTTLQLRKEFLTNHLGKLLTQNGSLVDTGTFNNFVWINDETVTNEFGVEVKEYYIYTNVQATAPTFSSATDTDSVTAKEIEVPLTCSSNPSVLDTNGEAVTMIVWRDDSTGNVTSLINQLFASTGAITMDTFLSYASGIVAAPTSGSSSDVTASVPVAVTGLAATAGNEESTITWTAVTGATSYNVIINGAAPVSVTSPTYTATGLTNGTEYTIQVEAVNAVGTGPSASVTVTPVASP